MIPGSMASQPLPGNHNLHPRQNMNIIAKTRPLLTWNDENLVTRLLLLVKGQQRPGILSIPGDGYGRNGPRNNITKQMGSLKKAAQGLKMERISTK